MESEKGGQLNQALRRRLGFATYLLRVARDEARRPVPMRYAALLTAHDAVELFLVLACEVHDAGRKNMPFLQYFEALKQKKGIALSQKKALSRLNDARVALKHYGTWPSDHDLDVFLTTADLFFEDNCPAVFGVDASSVSLVDFVRHSGAREELEKAEALLADGDLVGSVRCSAAGFAFCLKEFERYGRQFGGAFWPTSRIWTVPSGDFVTERLAKAVKDLEARVDTLQGGVALLAAGLDPLALSRFHRSAPAVRITASGKPSASYRAGQDDVEQEEAEFCLNFAVETCIQLEGRSR